MRRRDALKAGVWAFVAACTGRARETDLVDTDSVPGDTNDTDPDETCRHPMTPHGTQAQGWTRIPLTQRPELAEKYNGFETVINGQAVSIAHVDDNCFTCVSTVCTHEGCAVAYRSSRNQWVCPCHGAIYGQDGVPVAGPTFIGLTTFPTDFDGEAIWVKVD